MRRLLFFVAVILFLLPGVINAASITRPANALGLAGYWTFNEGAGTAAGDFSGHGAAGALSGTTLPAWVNGKRGGALDFDGSTSYVDLVNPSDLYISGDVTLSAWVYPRTLNSNYQKNPIISGRRTETSPVYGLLVAPNSIGVSFQTDNLGNGSLGYVNKTAATTINLNEWVHVTVVRSGTDLLFYKNGALVGQTTFLAGNLYASNGYLIGKGYNGGATFFNGLIDDVRIYNRALSSDEVVAMYRSGAVATKAVNKTGLVGYWSFDEGSGTQLGDFSGTQNNGILSGTALPQWVPGKLGTALAFDGVDSKIVTSGPTMVPSGGTQFTIMAWAKKNTTNGGIILEKNGPFILQMGTKLGSSSFVVHTSAGWAGALGNTTLQAGVWYHLALTYDANQSLISLYVDGKLDGTGVQTGGISPALDCIGIGFGTNGGCNGGSPTYFNGSIDEVRVYNRALSADEINAIYQTTATKFNTSQNTQLTDGLVGLWSFNGADVTDKIYDRSGQGSDGYFIGSATSSAKTIGKVGQALQFNGTNNYVSLGNSATLTPTTVTVSAWVYLNATTSHMSIYDNARDCCGTYNGISFRYDHNTGKMRGMIWNSSSATVSGSTPIEPGVWYHAVFTYDGATLKLYLNGVLDNSSVSALGVGMPASFNTYIGRLGALASFYWNGKLDEVRLYNRALSADEVKRLYNLGK